MKKLIAGIMVGICTISLMACGGKKEPSETTSLTNTETPTDITSEEMTKDKIGEVETDISGDKIVIGITQWPGSYVWYGTEKLGYFEKAGVNAEIRMFTNYSDGMNALSAGNIDGYVLSYSDTMAPYISGADFKVVMVEDYSAGSDGLVSQEGISSIQDLKDKTVATEIGAVDHMFLQRCLTDAGMTEADINLVNMSISDAGNAFIAGQIDAACIWDPFLTMAIDSGGVLLETTESYPGLIPAVLAINGETLKNKRDDVKKVIEAWFASLEGYENNYDEFTQAVSDGAEISIEEFEMLMKGVDLLSLEDNVPAFEKSDDYTSLYTSGKEHCIFLKSVEMIPQIPETLESLIDSSLIEELLVE